MHDNRNKDRANKEMMKWAQAHSVFVKDCKSLDQTVVDMINRAREKKIRTGHNNMASSTRGC